MNNKDSMRGLFFIVKGQHKRDNDEVSISGYNPYDPQTSEWYMLMDSKTFHCVSCGSDFNKVLEGVRTSINRHKGVARNYFKHVSKVTSDDYYEITYLGHRPLNDVERAKKAVGRCPRVSPKMRAIYQRVYDTYGDFYEDEIREMEDLAYSALKERSRPLGKTKTLKKSTKVVMTPPKENKVIDTTTPKRGLKMRPKLGLRRI